MLDIILSLTAFLSSKQDVKTTFNIIRAKYRKLYVLFVLIKHIQVLFQPYIVLVLVFAKGA